MVSPSFNHGMNSTQSLIYLSFDRTKVGRIVKAIDDLEPSDVIEYSNCNCLGYKNEVFPDAPVDRVPILDYSSEGKDECK